MTFLNILFLDDDPSEIELVEKALELETPLYSLTKVKSASEFCKHWSEGGYDVALAKASLALHSDPSILSFVRQGQSNAPFLVIGDSSDDNESNVLIQDGAADQIPKDQLHHLPTALLNAYFRSHSEFDGGIKNKEVWIFHRFTDSSTTSMAIVDLLHEDCPIIYCNEAFENRTGYKRDEVVGQKYHFLHRDDQDQAGINTLREALKEKRSGCATVRNYKKDGTEFWSEVVLFPLKNGQNQITHFMELQTDVSSGRGEEFTALLNQEILNHLIGAVYLFDPKTLKVSFVNEKAALYPEKEILGNPITDLFAVDADEINALIEEVVHEGRTHFFETKVKQKNGQYSPVETILIPLEFPEGGKTCLAVVKELSKIHQSEINLHQVTKKIPGAVFQFKLYPDGEKKFSFISEGIEGLIGYSNEVVTENFAIAWNTIHPDDVGKVLNSIFVCAQNQIDWSMMLRVTDREGRLKWLEGQASIVKQISEEGVITWNGFLWDVTKRVEAEEQVAWLQKMESMGELAGGVAHEINNQLFVVLGNCEYLLKKIESEEIREPMREIHLAASRSKKLVKELLAFSRRHVSEHVVVDLAKFIKTLKGMIQTACNNDVTVQFEIAEGLHNVKIDIGHFEQVLMNLILNAKDAMPEGGTIVVKAENYHSDGDFDLDKGDWVIVSVSDTGTGVPDEIKGRIFEPFFTTKPRGEGTGLGLSTSYGLIQEAGGQLLLESEIDRGSTFRICLRRCLKKEDAIPGNDDRKDPS